VAGLKHYLKFEETFSRFFIVISPGMIQRTFGNSRIRFAEELVIITNHIYKSIIIINQYRKKVA